LKKLNTKKLQQLITSKLNDFHRRRLAKLDGLKLKEVLRRKNPYLFKAVGTQSAPEIIESLLAAYMSSSDETIFGDVVFEPIALALCAGVTSPSEGVDLAIESDVKYLAVSVKSGPNPFNSSQRKKQILSLRSRVQKLHKEYDALLGYCYGQKSVPANKTKVYRESAGQEFWSEITGDKDFYLKLIKEMREDVIAIHRREYGDSWDRAVNRYVREFTNDFCKANGSIDWVKLTKFNSGAKLQKPTSKKKS
jgi:hypothetical protein